VQGWGAVVGTFEHKGYRACPQQVRDGTTWAGFALVGRPGTGRVGRGVGARADALAGWRERVTRWAPREGVPSAGASGKASRVGLLREGGGRLPRSHATRGEEYEPVDRPGAASAMGHAPSIGQLSRVLVLELRERSIPGEKRRGAEQSEAPKAIRPRPVAGKGQSPLGGSGGLAHANAEGGGT
jgi:hypothetical protein